MLKAKIRARVLLAMKARRVLERSILKVALGEIETVESRTGVELDEAAAIKIVRKLIKSNEESLAVVKDAERRDVLQQELVILGELVPQALDVDAIVLALTDVHEAIRAAKADGPAMGVAMRQLKSGDAGVVVEGKDVSAAVRRIRG